MRNRLKDSLSVVEHDLQKYKKNRDDVLLASIRKRIDKSILAYRKDMGRRSTIDSVELSKEIPKKGRFIVH